MSNNERGGKIPGDNPIRDPEDDVLGRNDVAESFVDHVLKLDVSEGAVVGVFGPWGSGKTSFINLARAKFKERGNPVFDFNPWMFSGTEQLVQRFFTELSSEFNLHVVDSKLAKIGKISKWLAPIVSIWNSQISRLMKALGESLQDGKKGIKGQREKISKALEREFEKRRGIVVLDDVDRLTTAEIRTVFKLVRLTANFPNLVYIVACDRFRVEEALGENEKELSGRDYLEKIFQLPYNLPEAPSQNLQKQIEESVARIEKSTHSTPFDQLHWHSVFLGIVEPLIRNMRDVRRYEASVRGTLINLSGQVELADVLGLEAVRIFLPDVFRLLPIVIDDITVDSPSGKEARDVKDRSRKRVSDESKNKEPKKIEELRKAAKTSEERIVVDQMLYHLFQHYSQISASSQIVAPSLPENTLLANRRVAHKYNLCFYLERVPGFNLLAREKAKEVLASMHNRDDLDRRIRSSKPEDWPSIIYLLSGFRGQFRRNYVEPGIIVLYNLFLDWPKNSPLSAESIVGGVALSLLKQTREEAEAIVRRVLPELTSLYSKKELIHLFGYQQKGDGFISKEAKAEFSEELFNHAQSMSSDDLAQEKDLTWTLMFIRDSGHPVAIADSPKITFALLQSSLIPNRGQPPRGLSWEVLVELYGAEDILIARVDSLNNQFKDLKPWIEGQEISVPEAGDIIKLAEQYREGWRPEDIFSH